MSPSGPDQPHLGAAELFARARGLVDPGVRRILGVTGVPGAGKTWLAHQLADALGSDVVHVPMDGFHLADVTLDRLGRRSRKGAIDTFDGAGYVALLRRVRDATDPVVYAPGFERDLEQPIAGVIAVGREVPLVVTEGNYLLATEPPWDRVRGLLDECWYVQSPEDVRIGRLVRRHIESGKDDAAARAWVDRVDRASADLIAPTSARADVIGVLG